MTVSLGLDIGSNSVGSAWIDTERHLVQMAVSVFPAGVEESENKRGAPVNQFRRAKRQQRRSLARRARRRQRLLQCLVRAGLLPADPTTRQELWKQNPWHLRREGLLRRLTPSEFGRVLVHLNQRRGAMGLSVAEGGENDNEANEDRKVLAAVSHVKQTMKDRGADTFGQLMADLYDQRQENHGRPNFGPVCQAIRNRRDSFEFHADRTLIHDEFVQLWKKQKELGGELSALLTDELCRELDDPQGNKTWRQRGEIFGQRCTFWDAGTLGRCELEPTDHRCPWADRHAQEFRVLETVNNLRIQRRDEDWRPLNDEERAKVIKVLRQQKSASDKTLRKALGIDKKAVKAFWKLNVEADKDQEINTDWFYREIVHGVFTEATWYALTEAQRESVNRAILKFDPEKDADVAKLRDGSHTWWGLTEEAATRLLQVWRSRPKLEKRINLSRRALLVLMPYFRGGLNVTQARKYFAEDTHSPATPEQRQRYALNARRWTKADRHYLKKHPGLLPPAPMLANPVVRKAIHEVRRHLQAWIRKFGCKPDRIVIEMVRSATQSEKRRNQQLAMNRQREKIRKEILQKHSDHRRLSRNQERAAVDRVLLCRQQRNLCPYSGKTITDEQAFAGQELELDHIIPYSRCGDNSLNNRVVCRRESNRGKSSKTPREWLSAELFQELATRLAFMNEEFPEKSDYFTVREYARKWENLHRQVKSEGEWQGSQLTDTAYAARQVASYLSDALYAGQTDGDRHIFFTKGRYTAILRRDWQLFQEIRAQGPTAEEEEQQTEKNRGDHRHHAIDAVAIALTEGGRLQRIAALAREQEETRRRSDRWPKRYPLEPPWDSIQDFRRQVLKQVFDSFQGVARDGESSASRESGQALVVSHRPIKRRLISYFHKEDCWGEVNEKKGQYRKRRRAIKLKPNYLRLPVRETDADAVKRLTDELALVGIQPSKARKKAKALVVKGQFRRKMVDPPLGKGGLVRDWGLRCIIRDCLLAGGLNPDSFTPKELQDFIGQNKLRMPSGVPITTVRIVGPMSDPVKIPVKDPLTGKQAINTRTGRPLFRYHDGQNNHHTEIRENEKTGEWNGECITMFEAVQRVRPPKGPDGQRQPRCPAVDCEPRVGQKFILSLAEGEMIHARRDDRANAVADFFVVVKLDHKRVEFAHHWDARPAISQDRWAVTYKSLKKCGPEPNTLPYKVKVDPLGQFRIIAD